MSSPLGSALCCVIKDAVRSESNPGPTYKGFTVQWGASKYVEVGNFQMGKLRPREGNFM